MPSPVRGQPAVASAPTGESAARSTPPLEPDLAARRHVRGRPVCKGERCVDLDAGQRHIDAAAPPRNSGSPWMADPRARARHHSPRAIDVRPDLPWLADLELPDLPVHWHPRIIEFLEFYKDNPRGRNIMAAWLRDQGKYRDLILTRLRKAGLPDDLLYVCMIESSYDPHDVSWAGASGLWQFMPAGGRVYGLRIDFWVDERNDPVRSTDAVLLYWADLYQRFGSWDLAMAAYNAGYGAVLRSIAKYNTNDFWHLLEYENALPWPARSYVPKALAVAIVGHNRQRFGFADTPIAPPLLWDTVTVPKSVSLEVIARAAGVEVAAVAELNPQLRRGRTPPDVRDYQVRLPQGSGQGFAERLAALRDQWEPYDVYTVRHGERFEDIATMYGISRSALRRLNGISHESEVDGGMALVVPRVSEEVKRRNHDKAMDDLYAGAHPKGRAGDPLIVAVPDRKLKVEGKRRVFYRVVSGDSQFQVAEAFGVDRVALAEWNGLDPEAFLHPRMVLQLFVDPHLDLKGRHLAVLDPSRLVVVDRGSSEHLDREEARMGRRRVVYTATRRESYADIGAKYGLKASDLARINRRPRTTVLDKGEHCIVYEVVKPARSERAAEQAARARAANQKSSKKRSKKKSSKKKAASKKRSNKKSAQKK